MPAQHNEAIIREGNLRVLWCHWDYKMFGDSIRATEALDLKSGLKFDE